RFACSSTDRCLVTACRVMLPFCDSTTIERLSPSLRVSISASRVGSASAAKTMDISVPVISGLSFIFGMSFDVADLLLPAAFVHPQRNWLALGGKGIETAFGHGQPCPRFDRLQPE